MTDSVSPEMRVRIEAELSRIETEEDVTILFAIESGSRAWGFHSPDSDYDVRFVYLRPVDWHLSLTPGRDVIERPLDDELDISGWDLRKTLNLLNQGNAVAGEWLCSPIVYRRRDEVDDLADLATRVLQRKPAAWHYVNLLERQWRRVWGPAGEVRLKKLFYTIRPALALRWMRLHDRAAPPMHMGGLIAACALDPVTERAIGALTELKRIRPEDGLADGLDPCLAALVEAEAEAARSWLEANRASSVPEALVAEAEALHVRLTRAASPS